MEIKIDNLTLDHQLPSIQIDETLVISSANELIRYDLVLPPKETFICVGSNVGIAEIDNVNDFLVTFVF